MPAPNRCFAFGQFIGKFLQKTPQRIAVIATGGLSHWPGEAKHGKINIPFDQQFLENLVKCDYATDCVLTRGNLPRGRFRRT
jgi:2,3-dihydroxyphenylpropionate 1,2-dioxygenase